MTFRTPRDGARPSTIDTTDRILDLLRDQPGRAWTTRQVRAELASPKPTTQQVMHSLRRLYRFCLIDRTGNCGYTLAADDAPPPPYRVHKPAPTLNRDAERAGCDPWRGPRDWFQHEARHANGITDRHLWINTICDTPMCMNHIGVLRAASLDYLPGVCVYCGLLADTKDHLIPRGWSGESARSGVLTVPACRECNSAIGAQWAPTITERRIIAQRYIRRRYSKCLTGSTLSDAELGELGRNLRSVIEAHQGMRHVARARLEWPGTELYDLEAAWRSGIEDPYAIGMLRSAA